MIISLDFMSDFYGLDKDKISDGIPLYCSKHNRLLISEYKDYFRQLRECLEITKGEHHDDIDMDESDSFSNWNISNLSHPEFKYYQDNNEQTMVTDQVRLKDEFYKVEKPKYVEEDDSLLPNDFYLTTEPLGRPIDDFNFAFISKQFYDYYERDMKQIEEGGRSSITISEIKDLKEFFIKAIVAYKDYDSELSKFYMKMFDA
jgi:hypothetical protein